MTREGNGLFEITKHEALVSNVNNSTKRLALWVCIRGVVIVSIF